MQESISAHSHGGLLVSPRGGISSSFQAKDKCGDQVARCSHGVSREWEEGGTQAAKVLVGLAVFKSEIVPKGITMIT